MSNPRAYWVTVVWRVIDLVFVVCMLAFAAFNYNDPLPISIQQMGLFVLYAGAGIFMVLARSTKRSSLYVRFVFGVLIAVGIVMSLSYLMTYLVVQYCWDWFDQPCEPDKVAIHMHPMGQECLAHAIGVFLMTVLLVGEAQYCTRPLLYDDHVDDSDDGEETFELESDRA